MNSPSDIDDSFIMRWLVMAQQLQADPIDLVRVAFSESNCRANAYNPNGGAAGLYQFMPSTRKGLGWTKTTEEFLQLSAADQVPFVSRYLRPYAFRPGLGGQQVPQLTADAIVYVATFLPALLPLVVGAGDRWREVTLCADKAHGGKLEWAYKANTVLDRMKADGTAGPDGIITPGDLEMHLQMQCKGPRYDAIVYRLRLAMGHQVEPPPVPTPTEKELPHLGTPDDDHEETQFHLVDSLIPTTQGIFGAVADMVDDYRDEREKKTGEG